MLRFGQIAIGSRSELEDMEHERDEWKARAEALAAQVQQLRIAALKEERPKPSVDLRYKWPSILAGIWLLIAGLFIGVVVPKAQGPSLAGPMDLPSCISKARYQHPIKGNQYQELVNALYACKVYGGTS